MSANEQRLFRRLGVFAAVFASTAETVCGEPDASHEVLEGIAALVEHSLIEIQIQPEAQPAPDYEPRFRLLETIREHALEQLTAAGEAQAARRRHAVACSTWPKLPSATCSVPSVARGCRAWTSSSTTSARRWPGAFPQQTATAEIGLRLVGSLSWYWYLRGHLHEGTRLAEHAVGLNSDNIPESARARA